MSSSFLNATEEGIVKRFFELAAGVLLAAFAVGVVFPDLSSSAQTEQQVERPSSSPQDPLTQEQA